MAGTGAWIENRLKVRAAGVRAVLVGGKSLVLTASAPVVVPITGLRAPGAESYGGQSIAHVPLTAGQTVTFAVP